MAPRRETPLLLAQMQLAQQGVGLLSGRLLGLSGRILDGLLDGLALLVDILVGLLQLLVHRLTGLLQCPIDGALRLLQLLVPHVLGGLHALVDGVVGRLLGLVHRIGGRSLGGLRHIGRHLLGVLGHGRRLGHRVVHRLLALVDGSGGTVHTLVNRLSSLLSLRGGQSSGFLGCMIKRDISGKNSYKISLKVLLKIFIELVGLCSSIKHSIDVLFSYKSLAH